MKTVKGDLIKFAKQGHFDIIVHGCNCFNVFGAGIALQMSMQFPDAYKADLKTVRGDREKLGTYSKAVISLEDKQLTVINAYTQYNYGGHGLLLDYAAIRLVFRQLNEEYKDCVIGIPKIGSGLANGDWNTIKDIIDEESTNNSIVLVEFGYR